MNHPYFSLSRLTPALGAVISGIDVKQLDEAEFRRLHGYWIEHKVLFIEDQELSLAALCAFSARFGPLMQLPYVEPDPDHANVIRVLKGADESGGVFGGEWHADFSFLPAPPMASILYALDIPPIGGDTLWNNMALAWQALSKEVQATLQDCRAVHVGAPYGRQHAPPPDTRSGASIKIERDNPEADRETLHPAVVRHPVTGDAILNINPTYTTRLEGLDRQAGKELLGRLFAHVTKPEFGCRYRWKKGAVAIWDNRSTLHYAINDYSGYRRELVRTAIRGEPPVGYGPWRV